MDVGMQTGDEEGSWKRETEEVYPKRTLNFLLALISVSFIILIIIVIIGLIFVLKTIFEFCKLEHVCIICVW